MTNGTSPPPTPTGVAPTVATPPAATRTPPPAATSAGGSRVSFETARANAGRAAAKIKSSNWGGFRTQAGEVSFSFISVGALCTFIYSTGYWALFVAGLPFGLGLWAITKDARDGDGKLTALTMVLIGCFFAVPLTPRVAPIFLDAFGNVVESFQEAAGGDQ